MLQALPKDRLVDRAAEAIRGYVAHRRLQPGERLPSEAELAQALGVSRNVVRQALTSLQALGLVDVQHGRGIFVASLDSSRVLDQFAAWINTSELSSEDFFETRLLFDRGVLELAVERIDEHTLARLEELAEAMAALLEEQSYSALHDEFHLTLLQASGNPFLTALGTILLRYFWHLAWQRIHEEGFPKHSRAELIRHHRQIVAVLRQRDRGMVAEVAARHLYGDERYEQWRAVTKAAASIGRDD